MNPEHGGGVVDGDQAARRREQDGSEPARAAGEIKDGSLLDPGQRQRAPDRLPLARPRI